MSAGKARLVADQLLSSASPQLVGGQDAANPLSLSTIACRLEITTERTVWPN